MSLLEEGGWSLGRHLEVIPGARVSSVTDAMRAEINPEEAKDQRLKWRNRQTWREDRNDERGPFEGRERRSPPRDPGSYRSALGPVVQKGEKGKGKGKGKDKGKR